MSPADPIDVALDVARALELARVPYAVAGGLASTIHGEPRATLDVDVVILIDAGVVDRLMESLADHFIADRGALQEAASRERMANVVHQPTYTKVDLYFRPARGQNAEEVSRALQIQLDADSPQTVRVVTPEDVVLQKLRWFRAGDEVSDRQWRDVLGVLTTQGGSLDNAYLDRWAVELGLDDLLDRARADVASG